MSFLALPNFRQSFETNGVNDRAWYTFFQGIWKGQPPSLESAVKPTGSPFTYNASSKGFLIVNGGTVSQVQWFGAGRGSAAPITTGQTQGCFPLSQNDSLIITYSVAPTLTFVTQ